MKKLFTTALTVITLTAGSITATAYTGETHNQPSIYPDALIIDEVNEQADTVTGHTISGVRFSFFGSEDWLAGDIAAVMMSDNGTTNSILDDQVITARYIGYTDIVR